MYSFGDMAPVSLSHSIRVLIDPIRVLIDYKACMSRLDHLDHRSDLVSLFNERPWRI